MTVIDGNGELHELPGPLRRPRKRVQVSFKKAKGVTHTEFAAQCDVNRIVKRWRETGQQPHLNPATPWYGDFTSADSFHEALARLEEVYEGFADLPSEIRNLCDNDPGKFIEMAEGEQLEDLVARGLKIERVDQVDASQERPTGATADAQKGGQAPEDRSSGAAAPRAESE